MSASATFNAWAIPWAEFMWSGLIDATLLLAIVALLWLPLRRRMSAQVGYCLFLLILVKLVVPIHVTAPGWLANLSPRNVIGGLTAWSAAPNAQVVPEAAELSLWELSPPELSLGAGASGEPGSGSSPLERIAGSPLTLPAVAAAPPLSLYAKLMLGWMVVVAVLFLRFVWVQGRMQRVIRQAMPLDPAALPVDFDGLRQLAGVRQPVHLVASPGLATPAVWGLFRPKLLVPPDLLEQLTANQLTWVLLHELAHIRRADLVVALVQRCVQIIYFFHPAVWLANWLIDHEREYACDDAALAACPFPRRDCGQGFLRIVERANAQPITIAPALGLFDGFFTYKTFIRSRLMRILDTQRSVRPGLSVGSTAFLLAMAVVVLPHLQAQQTKQDPQPVAAASPKGAIDDRQTSATAAQSPTPAVEPAAAGAEASPLAADGKVTSTVTARKLLERPGQLPFNSVSPDGRYITYVDTTGRKHNLAVRDVVTGEEHRLTKEGSESPAWPRGTFSPDGKQVAYSWHAKQSELRLVAFDGSEDRLLYRNEEVPYLTPGPWTPDGKYVVTRFQRKDQTWQIALVAVADGSTRVLKSFPDSRAPDRMSLSPDGRYLLYDYGADAPGHDLFLLALDGGRETMVAEHPKDDLAYGWAPDGKHILFWSTRDRPIVVARPSEPMQSPYERLWLLPVTDGKAAGDPVPVSADVGWGNPVGVALNGSLYYTRVVSTRDTHVTSLDPTTRKVVAPLTPAGKLYGFDHNVSFFDWSPDGQQLVYSGRDGLVIRTVASGAERVLTLDFGQMYLLPYYSQVCWFPDGRSLFASPYNPRDGKRGLVGVRIDAQTGEVTPLVPPLELNQSVAVAWSPNGKSLYYTQHNGDSRLLVRDLETGQDKELLSVKKPRSIFSPQLSPDGKLLLLSTAEQTADGKVGSRGLSVMPAEGGELREVLRLEPGNYIPGFSGVLTWTPDGRDILFVQVNQRKLDEGGSFAFELWRVSAEGGEPENLGIAMPQLMHLRIHPDGTQVAFLAGGDATEFWVMENLWSARK